MRDYELILTRMLDDEHAEKRVAAAIVIAEMVPKAPEVLDALRAAGAAAKDARLRRWVVEAIGAIGPDTIVQDLQPMLRDQDRQVRDAVKNVLATSKAVKESEIAKMLEGDDDKARLAAIGVLGAMGTARARKRLLGQLRGASPKISNAIIDALRPGLAEAGVKQVKTVIDELDALLETDAIVADADFAISAIQLLGHTTNEAIAPVLVRVAGVADADPEVRIAALETMQRLVRGRHAKLFESVLELVEASKTPAIVKAAALNALLNIEVPLQLEARVRGLLGSESAADRRYAIEALGTIDTAPAGDALAAVVESGTADDRELALKSALKTNRGQASLARLLGRLKDGDRAAHVSSALRRIASVLTPDTKHALEKAVMEAPPEIGKLILDVLKQSGDAGAREVQGNLLDKAQLLKNKRRYDEAIAMLRSLCQGPDADPEARFMLGVCELKTSKRKIVRGHNTDPCLGTFAELLRHKEFPLLSRLTSEQAVDGEDLFYLGFSFAERTDAEQGLGGDILVHIAEHGGDEKLTGRAQNKLKTMGWA